MSASNVATIDGVETRLFDGDRPFELPVGRPADVEIRGSLARVTFRAELTSDQADVLLVAMAPALRRLGARSLLLMNHPAQRASVVSMLD